MQTTPLLDDQSADEGKGGAHQMTESKTVTRSDNDLATYKYSFLAPTNNTSAGSLAALRRVLLRGLKNKREAHREDQGTGSGVVSSCTKFNTTDADGGSRPSSRTQKSPSRVGEETMKSSMRWSPFAVFTPKVVAIKEDWSEARKDELYNVVEYRWARNPFLSETPRREMSGSSSGAASSQHRHMCDGGLARTTHDFIVPVSTEEEIHVPLHSTTTDADPSKAGGDQRILGRPAGPAESHTRVSENDVVLTLWERREQCGPSVNDIRVTQREGIDNTGNFHWPTEDILCHYILRRWFEVDGGEEDRKTAAARGEKGGDDGGEVHVHVGGACAISLPPLLRLREPVSFLEIGAGCGLAAFVLARCAAMCGYANTSRSDLTYPSAIQHVRGEEEVQAGRCSKISAAPPPFHIVVTDGNSRVVETLSKNLEINSSATTSCSSSSTTPSAPMLLPMLVTPMVMHWKSADQFDAACRAMEGGVDVLVDASEEELSPTSLARRKVLFGADCLFFEDFHSDLADLILKFHHRFYPNLGNSCPQRSDAVGVSELENEVSQSKRSSASVALAQLEHTAGMHQPRLPLTLLMAPSRGGSLERFETLLKSKIDALRKSHHHEDNNNAYDGRECGPELPTQPIPLSLSPPLTVRRIEDFDPFISGLHQNLLPYAEETKDESNAWLKSMREQYNPSRHLPILLIVE